MTTGLARRMQLASARLARTIFCFSAICLFIAIIGVATLAARLGGTVLQQVDFRALEARLKPMLAGRKPGYAT